MRWLFALMLSMIAVGASVAQDMPLSLFLVEGEGWKTAPMAPKPFEQKVPSEWMKLSFPTGTPTAMAYFPTTGTLYVGFAEAKAVWAYPVKDGPNVAAGQPYCPVRLQTGMKSTAVSGLALDSRGCIYAAVGTGLHIYDPIGRLCGVVDWPAMGLPSGLMKTDDTIFITIGNQQFSRKLTPVGK